MYLNFTTHDCRIVTTAFIGVATMIMTAEWLQNLALFDDTGLLSWRVLRLRQGWLYQNRVSEPLFSKSTVLGVLVLRFVCAAGLVAIRSPTIEIALLAFILVSSIYLTVRTGWGGNGADQMSTVLVAGALLMSAGDATRDSRTVSAGVLLIGGQACISYFVSGAAKLVSRSWRSGNALPGVMLTQTYGHAFAAKLASSTSVAFLFCWSVIVTEMAFPVVLIAPPSLLLLILSGFMIFHLSNAVFMGLNGFVFTFIGTYPAVFVLNLWTRHFLGLLS
ncbi:MAG TPA: hypothetical protein VIM02_05655 [Rhizomicrobium sp.]|jgi:hypothetical protein